MPRIRWLPAGVYLLCTLALIVDPAAALAHPPPPKLLEGADGAAPGDEIAPADEQAMWAEIQRNLAALRRAGALAAPAAPAAALAWPLQIAPGLTDYAGFRVSAFADHNPSGGQVLDYAGGARTYDGHRGTDIALYPFSWNKLDAGAVQVIAAAAGTIVASANADATDHNCITSSADPWNYVALVHPDGRMTVYGHLRHNSLTSKHVGQTVAQGEYLGTVGSSGNSSGPHLHFEVRSGSFSAGEWVDPYAGPASQPGSLWASQRPYMDSAVDKLATHSAPPSTPDPCQPTIMNLQDSFTTPRTIYFYTYYRDYQSALATQLTLYRPDGSVFKSSQYAPGGSAFASAWSNGWAVSFANGDPAGAWRFEVSYNGQVYQTFFNLNAPPAVTLSSPAGGELWPLQVPHAVAWAANFGGAVNIALYRNGAYSATIASNVASAGGYAWAPSLASATGGGYTIRVSSALNPAVYAQSGAPFTLLPTALTQATYLPSVRR